MKSVMDFENHFSKQYFGLGILMAILPVRKLKLWEIPQFTLAKLFCGLRQAINKIGKQFLEDYQVSLWEEGVAVLCNQSSFRNFSFIP